MNKVSNSIFYIGANDHDVDLFEGQYVVPNGMAYNSYLIADAKTVVVDTIAANKTGEWLGNIEEVMNSIAGPAPEQSAQTAGNFLNVSPNQLASSRGLAPDYLVVQHMEPDHSASIQAFVEKYPKSDDAAALRFRYAQYLEQFKQMKDAKRIYLKLLTSSSNYKDSAFAAIRRLRKVRGAPETLEEKVAYAKVACAKDNAGECLVLLDSIHVLDSMLVSLSPEAALPSPEDSLQKKLPPSSLDMATRINLWEKRAVTLRTLKREDESIKQFKFLLDSVDARPLWMQSILRLYRNNALRYEKEIRKMDAALQDASQYSKENANNLWVKGFEYEQKENYDSAIVCYKALSHKRF